MVLTLPITNTKPSKFGNNYEKVLFPNGEWYDVEKGNYVWAKYHNNGQWFITNKNEIY